MHSLSRTTGMRPLPLVLLVLAAAAPASTWGWVVPSPLSGAAAAAAGRATSTSSSCGRRPAVVAMAASDDAQVGGPSRRRGEGGEVSRADAIKGASILSLVAAAVTTVAGIPAASYAAPARMEPLVLPALKGYEDPEGLFKLQVPEGWFTKRKNPKGPEGEGIVFISGDFNKAITLSVEVLRVTPLMKRAGINVTDIPSGGYPAWDSYASSDGMAGLLAAHKEAMVGGPTKNVYRVLDETIKTDAGTLTFDFETDVRVERPDLLMEEMGVSKLERHTTGRALLIGDDKAMIVWSAALSTDWGRGYDKLLTDIVNSLVPTAAKKA